MEARVWITEVMPRLETLFLAALSGPLVIWLGAVFASPLVLGLAAAGAAGFIFSALHVILLKWQGEKVTVKDALLWAGGGFLFALPFALVAAGLVAGALPAVGMALYLPAYAISLIPHEAINKVIFDKKLQGVPFFAAIRTSRSDPSANPRQASRIELIRDHYGIIGPDKEISREVDSLARQALRTLGLAEEEFAVVVTDADEVNASFYLNGEKVVVFHRGLLEFMKREGIFNRDTILFILGHEAGHALQEERKKKDRDYNPSGLIAEYDADEKGLRALDGGDGRGPLSPVAGMGLMKALRSKESRMAAITTTHPHSHRREAKIYNDIRHKYWQNLDAEPQQLPPDILGTKRSERFNFDDQLYGSFSVSHFALMAERASSVHDLKKIMGLYYAVSAYRAILDAFREKAGSAVLDLSEAKVREWLDGANSPSARAAFIMRMMQDQNVKAEDYFTAEEARAVREMARAHNIEMNDEGFAIILANQAADLSGFLLKSAEDRDPNYAWLRPDKATMGKEEEDLRNFLQNQIQIIHEGKESEELEKRLENRARTLVPSLAQLTENDQAGLIEYGVLGPIHFLLNRAYGPVLSERDNPFREKNWDDPSAVAAVLLTVFRKYSNDYLDARGNNPVFSEIIRFENFEVWGKIGRLTSGVDNYTHLLINALMGDIANNGANKEALVRLYEALEVGAGVRPGFTAGRSSSSKDELEKVLLSKIESPEEFVRLFGGLGWKVSLGVPLIDVFRKAQTRELLVQSFGDMLRHPHLWEQATKSMRDFAEVLYDQFNVSAEEGVVLLEGLLSESNVEERIEGQFVNGGGVSPSQNGIENGLAFFLGKISDQKPRFEIGARLYGKRSHNDASKYFSGDWRWQDLTKNFSGFLPFRSGSSSQEDGDFVDTKQSGPIYVCLKESLEREGVPPLEQLALFLEHGIVPERGLWNAAVNDSDKENLFAVLIANESEFIRNGLTTEHFNTLLSMVAWSWFFNGVKGQRDIAPLAGFINRLRPSLFNERAWNRFMSSYGFENLTGNVWEIVFQMCASMISPIRENSLEAPSSMEGPLPVWARAKENPKNHPALTWGDRVFVAWKRAHSRASPDQILQAVLKAYPQATEHRNKVLIDLVGNPLRDAPNRFINILPHLHPSPVRDILARRMLEADIATASTPLQTYQDVQNLVDRYFPRESEIKNEVLLRLLQDVETSVDELEKLRGESVLEQTSRSRAAGIGHRVLEHLGDALENHTATQKRETFEWLIGVSKEKPDVVQVYEEAQKVDLTDLPLLLSLATETDRYLFLTTLFIGPVGLLANEGERRTLIENIFRHGLGEEPNGDNKLCLIFVETFNASPELKQLDLIHGIFGHFLKKKGNATDGRNELIRDLLASFGVVGVKLGQVLAKQSIITSADLRAVLESLSDRVTPMDKRYLMGALLFDNSFGSLKERIKTIGRLLGSASIKQGYMTTLVDGRQVALKYIRPLARYEVRVNMEILKKVINNLRGKIEGLENISDTLVDQVGQAVRRELDMAAEVEGQKSIGATSNGDSYGGWRLNIPRVDGTLEGRQFFADDFVRGEPLKSDLVARLRGTGDYPAIAALVYRALLKQMLINGRYHADLHAGNILVDVENKTVHILDFGNTGILSSENQDAFILFLSALDRGDSFSALGELERMATKLSSLTTDERDKLVGLVTVHGASVEAKLRDIKVLLSRNGVEFTEQFEVLFKVFETVTYLTGSVLDGEPERILRGVVLRRQFISVRRIFSRTTWKLLKGYLFGPKRGAGNEPPMTPPGSLDSDKKTVGFGNAEISLLREIVGDSRPLDFEARVRDALLNAEAGVDLDESGRQKARVAMGEKPDAVHKLGLIRFESSGRADALPGAVQTMDFSDFVGEERVKAASYLLGLIQGRGERAAPIVISGVMNSTELEGINPALEAYRPYILFAPDGVIGDGKLILVRLIGFLNQHNIPVPALDVVAASKDSVDITGVSVKVTVREFSSIAKAVQDWIDRAVLLASQA
ncbi:MAG: M48 family metalloprotease [Elusimicrobia bacterium]|nr:M48 family metalloprotease [Elusimicrobiota bacterium]